MSEKQDAIPEGINELPDPSAFAAPEGETLPKEKAARPHQAGAAEYQLLDGHHDHSIGLLIKSYSSDPVTLKQTEDLKPPFFKFAIEARPIDDDDTHPKGVLVDDEPAVQIATSDGQIAESDREGGGFLISPVFTKLEAAVEHQKEIASYNASAEFKGLLTIISDRNVPFSLISQAMYTAGKRALRSSSFL